MKRKIPDYRYVKVHNKKEAGQVIKILEQRGLDIDLGTTYKLEGPYPLFIDWGGTSIFVEREYRNLLGQKEIPLSALQAKRELKNGELF